MKAVVISTAHEAAERYAAARSQGYVTFVYTHADPKRCLSDEAFVYVRDDQELIEKLNLVRADVTVVDELLRG